MESTNLHHFQHQPPAVDTSPVATPSCYVIESTHSWSPQISSNAGNLIQIVHQEAASRSRDSTLNSCMIQNLGYHSDAAESWLIEEDQMCGTFPKFTEMLKNSASNREQHYWRLQEPRDHLNDVISEKLSLNTLSSSDFYSTCAGGLGAQSRGNFSQIHPTINISNLNNSSPAISKTSSNMNLSSLYPLSSPRFGGDSSLSLHMQNPVDRSSTYISSISSHFTNNAIVETKRPSASMESKPSQSQTTPKKLRPDQSRSSCPPLKVRKEKLGDRIAALQQLVAPFGKTDTASVLMEAIGYIKFLQDQVETLSVPYIKSSRNQNSGGKQKGSGKDVAVYSSTKPDLRSRGLCLVPLSCMSFITGDHAPTGVWHPPSFDFDGPS